MGYCLSRGGPGWKPGQWTEGGSSSFKCVRPFVLSQLDCLRVVLDCLLDGFAAGGAEDGVFVGAHTAVEAGTVDTLALVAAALENADTFVHRGGIAHQPRPFLVEVGERGQVRLPRLDAGGIESFKLVVVEILVGQSRETVAKFVHDNGAEPLLACAGHGV